MYCISVNYKTAGLELRRRLAFDNETCRGLMLKLLKENYVTECVMLCTCNRTELYFCGAKGCESGVVRLLSEQAAIGESLLSKHLMFFYNDGAITHLFKVACGIDSMVIGEDEILGQTRNAYYFAKENNAVSHELNMVFQAAIACAKKIKTQTLLSKTSVSVATLAANEAARLGEKVSVLIIGASGKIGSTVLKNLVSHKNVSVKATLRSHKSKLKFIDGMGVETVDYSKRYEYIVSSDCVISATSGPHYTVTYYDLKNHLSGGGKKLFIDLAVPPDIEQSVTELDGVSLINIDYFERLAEENNTLKADGVVQAEEIIAAETAALKKDLIFHGFLPELERVRAALSGKPFEELIYKMKAEVSPQEFSAFLKVLKAIGDGE